MSLTISADGEGLRLEVLMKPEIRAAADKELPPDHAPFDFGLLPGDSDECVITGGAFKGQSGFFTRDQAARSWESTSPAGCSTAYRRGVRDVPVDGREGSGSVCYVTDEYTPRGYKPARSRPLERDESRLGTTQHQHRRLERLR
jgi:hypothetical protein